MDLRTTLSHQNRYQDIIGQVVSGKIDRPKGSCHPRHKEMIYPINYGYVTGIKGGDGAEQDIYLFGGENSAVAEYTGKVIAVYHDMMIMKRNGLWFLCDEKELYIVM